MIIDLQYEKKKIVYTQRRQEPEALAGEPRLVPMPSQLFAHRDQLLVLPSVKMLHK